MATKNGRSQIWYADGNGNVAGYTESVDDIAGTIIDAYNEHFGTDIQIWTPETKTLQVGGTVPNWNAYEKIEMPETKEYLGINYGAYAAGYLENENVYLYGYTSTGNIIVCSPEGLVYQGQGANLNEELREILTGKLNNAGIKFNEFIVIETPYANGETIENWENYQKIS